MVGENNSHGMVYDYTHFPKEFIMGLDHKLLVAQRHVKSQVLKNGKTSAHMIKVGDTTLHIPKEDVVVLEGIVNTTAEELARWLYIQLNVVCGVNTAGVHSVSVSETPATRATYPEGMG